MKTVKGSFEVDGKPLPMDEASEKLGLMRMCFEKKFKGPLTAEGLVSMQGIMIHGTRSGAYVAIERITGTLEGRRGSFYFAHSSQMDQGKPVQSITVVPESGTGEFKGLRGSMVVDIVDDEHFYTFEYSLP